MRQRDILRIAFYKSGPSSERCRDASTTTWVPGEGGEGSLRRDGNAMCGLLEGRNGPHVTICHDPVRQSPNVFLYGNRFAEPPRQPGIVSKHLMIC